MHFETGDTTVPVISLSLIPSRFAEANVVLEALLAQDVPDTKVEVYIPKRYRRFPDYDGRLPQVPKGVEICVVEEDLGPATKELFAADRYKDEAVDILFCDDDRIYARNWARGFLDMRAKRPNDAIAGAGIQFDQLRLPDYPGRRQPQAKRAIRTLDVTRHLRRVAATVKYGGSDHIPLHERAAFKKFRTGGYVEIAEGFGGVLIKPQFFDRSMWQIPPVMWAVDDVWLSGHLARKGIGIWVMPGAMRLKTSPLDMVDALHQSVIDGAHREQANLACVRYMQETFGIWGGCQAGRAA